MTTPIYDFVQNYVKADFSRFHMPGHKGRGFMGFEKYDITEIDGADVLYGNYSHDICGQGCVGSSCGIIRESENNASAVFRTSETFYSTEGSSLAIKAMIGAVSVISGAANKNRRAFILAARNVHKSFIYACAIFDIDVAWMYPDNFTHLCSCVVSPKNVEKAIKKCDILPDAIYITSPDYLGNMADISGISKICEKYGILLIVDNAHGAYLGFLDSSLHPIHLGAHMCCDSAHKTLPVLTGGAYIHFSESCPDRYISEAFKMMQAFASTSPSYLILQSLDLCNKYLKEGFKEKLVQTAALIEEARKKICTCGFMTQNTEPLKIVVNIKKCLYSGFEFVEMLRENKIIPEFYDNEYIVFMISPENDSLDIERLVKFFESISFQQNCYKTEANSKNSEYSESIENFSHDTVMSIRRAIFSEQEILPVHKSAGRVCGAPAVSCPPAVPIIISGELITQKDVNIMEKYEISHVNVVK